MSVITNSDRILFFGVCMRTYSNCSSICIGVITNSCCKLCTSICTVTECTCGVLSSSCTVTYCSRTNLSCLGYITDCNRSFTTCNRAYTHCSRCTAGCDIVITYCQCCVCSRSIVSTVSDSAILTAGSILITHYNRVDTNVSVRTVVSAIRSDVYCATSQSYIGLCSARCHQSTCCNHCSSYGFTLVRSGFFAVCMADLGNRGPCLGRVVPNDFKDFIHIDFPVRGLISFGTCCSAVNRLSTHLPHFRVSPLCGFMP